MQNWLIQAETEMFERFTSRNMQQETVIQRLNTSFASAIVIGTTAAMLRVTKKQIWGRKEKWGNEIMQNWLMQAERETESLSGSR